MNYLMLKDTIIFVACIFIFLFGALTRPEILACDTGLAYLGRCNTNPSIRGFFSNAQTVSEIINNSYVLKSKPIRVHFVAFEAWEDAKAMKKL